MAMYHAHKPPVPHEDAYASAYRVAHQPPVNIQHFVLAEKCIRLKQEEMIQRRLKNMYRHRLRYVQIYKLGREQKNEKNKEKKMNVEEEKEKMEHERPTLHPSNKEQEEKEKEIERAYQTKMKLLKERFNEVNPDKKVDDIQQRRHTMPIGSPNKHSGINSQSNALKERAHTHTGHITYDEAEDKLLGKVFEGKRTSMNAMQFHAKNKRLKQDILHIIAEFENLENATNIKSSFSTQVSDLKRVIVAHEEEEKIVEMKMSKLSDLIKQKEVQSKKEIERLMKENEELKLKMVESNRRQTTLSTQIIDLEDTVSKNAKAKQNAELELANSQSLILQKQAEAYHEVNTLKKEMEELKSKFKAIITGHFSDRYIDKRRRTTSHKNMDNKKKNVAMSQRNTISNQEDINLLKQVCT